MDKELCELVDELYNFVDIAKREVRAINEKGNLTPSEVDCVHKIAEIVDTLKDMSEPEEYGNDYGYGYGSMGRRYNSGRMERSPVTGRYISRGNDGYSRNGDGYSGHSIEDRMIMSLEQQMDNAKTDYERKIIEDEIRHIREGQK